MARRTEDAPPAARTRRGRLLRVRVHEADLARWREAARRHRVNSLSRWLRAAADQAVACGDDPLGWRRDLSAMLRSLNGGVGNNLNQIARALIGGNGLDGCADALARIADDLAGLRQEIRAHLLGTGMPRRRKARSVQAGRAP